MRQRMKKWRSLLWAVCLLVFCPILSVEAEDKWYTVDGVVGGQIEFDAETGVITGCERSVTQAIIPEQISGVTVIGIDHRALENCSNLSKIILPSTIESMGANVFSGCSKLTSAGPIGSGCAIEYGWEESIPERAFSSADWLIKVELPSMLKSIGASAFRECSNLSKITLPSTIETIGKSGGVRDSVFSGCSKLTSAGPIGSGCNIEYGWEESIPEYAFYYAESLVKVKLPSSIKSIGESAFKGCTKLITAGPIGSGCNIEYGWEESIPERAFYNVDSLVKVELSSMIKSIKESAFKGCINLNKITLPSTIESIGNYVFEGCSKLTSAGPIGSGCNIEYGWKESIPARAFYGGDSLKSIEISTSIKNIGEYAFAWCSSLEDIELPIGLTSIGQYAFLYCTSLVSIEIPDSVTCDGRFFWGCTSLVYAKLSKGMTNLESQIFYYCSNLETVVLSPDLKFISSVVFSQCYSLKNVVFLGFPPQSIVQNLFKGFVLNMYYPQEISEWELFVNSPYWGGNLTWIPYTDDFPEELLEPKKVEIISETKIPSSKSGIFIIDRFTGNPIEGASVKVGEKTFITDASGIVFTDYVGKYNVMVTVDETLVRSTEKNLKHGSFETITVVQPEASEKLSISSIDISIDGKTMDLIDNSVYLVHKDLDKVNEIEKYEFKLQVKASGEPRKYQLIQNGEIIEESVDGKFTMSGYIDRTKKEPVYYTDFLKAGYKIQVKVYDKDGNIAKQVLGLKISESSSLSMKDNLLYGSSSQNLEIGEKLTVTVPNDIPLIGGSKLDLGLTKDCPIKISVDDDGKVKVAVNMGEFDSADSGAWSQKKEEYQNLAKRAELLSGSALQFGGTPQSFGAGLFSVKAEVTGYGEGYLSDIKDGRLRMNLGLLIEVKAEKTVTKYFFIAYVPVYINFGGGVEMNAGGTVNLVYENAKFDINGGNFEIEPGIYVRLKGGVGVEEVLDVNASGKLKLSYLYRFSNKYQKVTLGGNAKISATALFWSKDFGELDGSWVIYDSNRKTSVTFATPALSTSVYHDLSDAQLISMDYLFKRDERKLRLATANTAIDSTLILDYAFQNASPKLVKTENAIYIFYLDGVKGREIQNQSALFYKKSVDNGVTWSNAIRVDHGANETADYNFDVAADGNNLYVVWSDAGKVYGDEVTTMDSQKSINLVLGEMNLMMAQISEDTGATTMKMLSTENADLQPKIMVDDVGVIHIGWIMNDVSEEEVFSVENTFSIAHASSDTDYQVMEHKLAEGFYPLTVNGGRLDGKAYFSVDVDVDGQLGTQEDREIYLLDVSASDEIKQISSNEVIDSVPVFAKISGKDGLFWYQDGNIVYTTDMETTTKVFEGESSAELGQQFAVLENENGNVSIVWTVTSIEEERGIDVYCTEFNGDSWSPAFVLGQLQSEYTAKLSGYQDGEDYRIIYLGKYAQGDQLTSKIFLMNPQERIDTDIEYSMDVNGIAGSVYPITVRVQNTGNTLVDKITISVEDGSLSKSFNNLNIEPGEMQEIVYDEIILPMTMSEVYEDTLIVKADGETDLETNRISISVGHADFSIDTYLDTSNGEKLASVSVKNEGVLPADAVLHIYKNEALTEKVYEIDLQTVVGGEARAMVLNTEALAPYAEALYFVILDKSGTEIYFNDNQSVLYVAKGFHQEIVEQTSVTRVFSDIPAGKWYVSSVQYVYDNGYMSGSNGLFNPEKNINRAQFVTTLYRVAGEPEVTNRDAVREFSDVAEGEYYTNAVCWAYENNITTGSNGKFNTYNNLSRQQLATFLYRFAKHIGADVSASGDYTEMPGADEVQDYAKEAMKWAVEAGIISGSGANKDLKPAGNATRAQMATILQRFCENNGI